MAGISSKAVLKALTPYKANGGCQFEDEGSLDYYNTFYRKYDAQIGRFTGIDTKAESFAGLSPFQFGNNNPVFYNDPMGDKFVNIKPADPMANTFAWALNYRSSIVDDNPSMKIQSMWDNIMSGGGGGGGGGVTAYKEMTSFSGDVAKAVFAALFCQNESDAVDIQVDFGEGGSILGISSTYSAEASIESPSLIAGYVCGDYNWKETGDAYTAQIQGLYVYASHKKWGSFRIDVFTACVSLPKYALGSPKEATKEFNNAWNDAVKSLDNQLNAWSPGDPLLQFPTMACSQPFFIGALMANLYTFNPASTFNYGGNGCAGSWFQNNTSYAQICNTKK